MELINYVFLALLFPLAVITSYEDFKYGKIRNQWIVLGLGAGLAMSFSFYFLYYFQFEYFYKLILNFIAAIIVGFIMWKKGIWAAGDAKLFMVFSLLLPLKYYSNSYLFLFPSFAILVNIFVLIIFYLLFQSLKHKLSSGRILNYKKIKNISFKKFLPKNVLTFKIFVFLLFIMLFFNVVYEFLPKKFLFFDFFALQSFIFAFFILFNQILTKFLQKEKIFKLLLVFFIIELIAGYGLYGVQVFFIVFNSLKIILIFGLTFLIIKSLINYYINNTLIIEVKANEIKKGDLVEKNELEELKIEEDKREKRLNKKEADLIKQKAFSLGKEKIKIYKKFPFAFWMGVGVLATIFVKGSIINFFLQILK